MILELENSDPSEDVTDDDDPEDRILRYQMGPDFLNLQTVGVTIIFTNGE